MNIISSLAKYQHLTSKNYGERNTSDILYIIPHHMAGVMGADYAASWFCTNGLRNSVNYCIGYNGGISCNVPENQGPWTSSWWRVDTKAITIEVSNSTKTSDKWPISDAAKEDLIKLMVDVIQRNPSLGGKAVFDPSDEAIVVAARAQDVEPHPKGNILLHNWTDPERKNCPGPYITQNMPAICAEVNRRLADLKSKKDKLIDALEELGDGRYKYYDGSANSVGCSKYLELALKKAGIIKEGETFHAASGNVGVLGDTTRFQKIPWSPNNLQKADIMWSQGHHVATWDGKNGVYEAAPESSHGICDNGKTGVGHYSKHTYYNCGTGTKTWTCIYRIIEKQPTRTLFEEAQYMIDNGIGGEDRKTRARNDGFDPAEVQAQIDRMLAKNPMENVEVLAKIMPVLKKGSENVSVYALQELLNYMGYYNGEMDGKYGDQTEAAVKRYQKNNNIVYKNMEVDGICGSATWLRILTGK